MIARIVHFFGDAEYAARRRKLLYATLFLVVAADFLVSREDGEFIWDRLPGWNALYGLVSCALIVFVSKFLGHRCGLMRREDYYD